MEQTEIDELRLLHERATPRPWTPNYTQSGVMAGEEYVACEGYDLNGSGGILEQQDLDLIVAARNALPRLLAALEEAQAKLAKVQDAMETWFVDGDDTKLVTGLDMALAARAS